MTENEALKLIKSLVIDPKCELVKTFDFKATVIKALEYLQQYRAIGTVEEIQSKLEAYRELGTMEELKALKEKSVAKNPDYEGDGCWDGHIVIDTWICPNCEKHYEVDYDDYDYCPNCGQHIDHSGLTEDD